LTQFFGKKSATYMRVYNVDTLVSSDVVETVTSEQWLKQGGFIQYMVVICIWCALFVTSQFDVIFMFSSEVC